MNSPRQPRRRELAAPRSIPFPRSWPLGVLLTIALLFGALVAARIAVDKASAAGSPQTELISQQANDGVPLGTPQDNSHTPTISGDGQFVAFTFQPDNPSGALRDRQVPATLAIQNAYDHTTVSRDGCFVAFNGFAPGGRQPQVLNRCAGGDPQVLTIPSALSSGMSISRLDISAHGRFVAVSYRGTGTPTQVVVVDRNPSTVGYAALASASEPSLGDENLTTKIALRVTAPPPGANLPPGVVLWDPNFSVGAAAPPAQTRFTPISVASGNPIAGNGVNESPSMTPDGRFVAFASTADNLTIPTGGLEQIYVHDVANNVTKLVTHAAAPSGDQASFAPSISADGTQIAFETTAANLLSPVPGLGASPCANCTPKYDLQVATNRGGFFDTVAYDRVQVDPNGNPFDMSQNADNFEPQISSNGRWVAFTSGFNQALGAAVVTTSPPTSGGSTPTSDTSDNVYVHGRPTALTISTSDFGNVTLGQTAPTSTTTVTNSGISSVLPATITAADGQFVITGGTCQVNVWISPGQSCTVTATFTPSAVDVRAGTLTISEAGFRPVVGTGAFSGTGVLAATVPQTNPPTNPPTDPPTAPPTAPRTVPRTTPRTAPPTAPPTVPKVGALVFDPPALQFGLAAAGAAAAPVSVTLSSTGTASVAITSVAVTGANAGEFTVTTNGCDGLTLAPSQTCAITLTFTPSGAGDRTATLTAGSATVTATAALDGQGIYQPTLRLIPDMIPIGQIAVAFGDKFPPATTIQLKWASLASTYTAITDANGRLTVQIPIRSGEPVGRRTLQVVDQPTLFTSVTAPALIVAPNMQPPSNFNPAFNGITVLVIRG